MRMITTSATTTTYPNATTTCQRPRRVHCHHLDMSKPTNASIHHRNAATADAAGARGPDTSRAPGMLFLRFILLY